MADSIYKLKRKRDNKEWKERERERNKEAGYFMLFVELD
jgi:hypothetical protein